jgi:hypothetical protein
MSRSRSQSLTKWSIFASSRSCRTPIPPSDLMLAPLSDGKHSLHFTGTFPQFNFTINVTYNLTVREDQSTDAGHSGGASRLLLGAIWLNPCQPHFLDGQRFSSVYRGAMIIPNRHGVNPQNPLIISSVKYSVESVLFFSPRIHMWTCGAYGRWP